MESQRTMNSQTILKKKSIVGGFMLSDFKTYYRATIIRTMWYWHEDRHVDE